MTLDERLEKLTESIELQGRKQREEYERSREEYARWRQAVREEEERRHEEDEKLRAEAREADARFRARIDEVLEGINALARLAGVQGVRLNNHESRISTLEKGTPPSAE
jgi:hypothetical protein